MATVNVRNLEQIQEDAPGVRSSKVGALVLASIGGAALVVVGVLTFRGSDQPTAAEPDPLAALVADSKSKQAENPTEVDNQEISFPGLLSDAEKTTTAFAGVSNERGRLREDISPSPHGSASPPPATDRLPVVPLPAGDLLNATPVTTAPKDALTAMASSRSATDGELAPVGKEGGFQIQVASFKKQEDADVYVEQLRRRGHSAYRQAANVPARGLWHRVRIGPFKSKFSAMKYKKEFERKERVSPFIVDPHKVKMQQAQLEARRAARERRRRR